MLQKIKTLLPKYAIFPLALAVLINMSVYFGVAQFRKYLTFYSMETPLDNQIPFLAPFVLFYELAFAQWVINYILIAREGKTFCYHFAFGDVIAKIICLFFFLFLPTTLTRPNVTGTGIFDYMVRFIYASDPPVNLFPSIHCLESWCCIHAAFRMKKVPQWYRIVTVFMSLCVFASTLFIKQHVLIDVFGGIAVFEIGYWLMGTILRRKKMQPDN